MAAAVRERRRSARRALVQASLERIAATDARVNAFTDVTAQRALRRAAALDARARASATRTARALPLLGVPFAVKNLFDVAGLADAGRLEDRARARARRARRARWCGACEAAGAVLVGALNMDEYAYGFTTENTHDGAVPQPARPDAHRRRLVGRLGRGGRGRPGAAHAGLRHQRLDPRARRRCAASSA